MNSHVGIAAIKLHARLTINLKFQFSKLVFRNLAVKLILDYFYMNSDLAETKLEKAADILNKSLISLNTALILRFT